MSQSHMTFSIELKTKIVLELLQGNPDIANIANKYGVMVENLLIWKHQFLTNASCVFEKQCSMKSLQKRVKKYTQENEELASMVEKVTHERDVACKKLQGLSIPNNKIGINIQSHTSGVKKQREMISLDYLLIS